MGWSRETTYCPCGVECACCGARLGLAARPVDSAIGVGCVTLCGRCHERGRAEDLGADFTEMARHIPAHAQHLGVTVGELVAAAGTLGDRSRGRPHRMTRADPARAVNGAR
jgi:hypothetical protein